MQLRVACTSLLCSPTLETVSPSRTDRCRSLHTPGYAHPYAWALVFPAHTIVRHAPHFTHEETESPAG